MNSAVLAGRESAGPSFATLLLVLPEEQALRCITLLRREGIEVVASSVVHAAPDRANPPLMLPRWIVAVPVFGDVVVDECAHEVRRAGEPVRMTPVELALLLALVRRKGRLVTKEELTRAAWRSSAPIGRRVLATHILNLRGKLEPTPRRPRHILTVWGRGYRLVE
jgi:DNA-binding response OmpR family regulator